MNISKKKITKEALINYAKDQDTLDKLYKFYDITKGLIKFTCPNKVKKLFELIEE